MTPALARSQGSPAQELGDRWSFDQPDLADGVDCTWRVIACDAHQCTAGPTWSFTAAITYPEDTPWTESGDVVLRSHGSSTARTVGTWTLTDHATNTVSGSVTVNRLLIRELCSDSTYFRGHVEIKLFYNPAGYVSNRRDASEVVVQAWERDARSGTDTLCTGDALVLDLRYTFDRCPDGAGDLHGSLAYEVVATANSASHPVTPNYVGESFTDPMKLAWGDRPCP